MPKKPTFLGLSALVPCVFATAGCSGDVVDLGGGSEELSGTQAACAGGSYGVVNVFDQAGLEALRGCEELESLSIFHSGGWLRDLRPLSSLRVVRDGLAILNHFYTPADGSTYPGESLESLEGLESLQRVSSLELIGFSAPTLEPLRNLEIGDGVNASGSIHIQHASELRNLSGLDNVVGLSSLLLDDNPQLETLEGLQQSAFDRLAPYGVVALLRNPKLEDIGALSGWAHIHIESTGIEHLDLAPMQDMDGLIVKANPALLTISGLDTQWGMSTLHIQNNARLRELPEFPELRRVASLIISGNPELQTLPTFPKLQSEFPWGAERAEEHGDVEFLTRTVKIADNASLQHFTLPAGLQEVLSVFIQGNASLSEVDLGGLEAVTQLTISNNPSLKSVGIDRLQTVNALEILDNAQLPTADFAGVQTFTHDIQGNAGEAAP